ncbi:MAG: zinc ribbon domain-containing protein [Flavobacteriales bacterium]|nr:zinc ribbon domain-containing protein [Flavobacteriales bacterium]
MALLPCKNCGHKISEFAEFCPKCKVSTKPEETAIVVKEDKVEDSKQSCIEPSKATLVNSSKKKNRAIILWSVLGAVALIFVLYGLDVALNSGYDTSGNTNSISNDYENGLGDEVDSYSRSQPNNQNDRTSKPVVQAPSEEDIRREMYRENLGAYVTLEVNNYGQKVLGGIKNLEVTITNNMEYSINSAIVQIDYYKMNDKLYTTKYVQFGSISANHRLTKSAPETEWGAYVRCSIKSLDIPELNQ